MVTRIDEGFVFTCGNDVVTFKLHGSNDCCEIMTRDMYLNEQTVSEIVTTWSRVEKAELPQYVQDLEDLNNDQWDDKRCELVAIKLIFDNGADAYLVVANKHNGYYAHEATIESTSGGVLFQTFL